MITSGTKIIAVKEMGGVIKPNEVCEVIKVTEDGVISFRFRNAHMGVMSFDEYKTYFKLYEEQKKETVKPKRKWTEWKDNDISVIHYNGDRLNIKGQIRSNGKIVEVRVFASKNHDKYIKAKASCCKGDKFSLKDGKKLAEARLRLKIQQLYVKEVAGTL